MDNVAVPQDSDATRLGADTPTARHRRSTRPGRALAAVLFGMFASLGSIASAQAATTWNLAIPYPSQNFLSQNDRAFAKDVEQMTQGKLKIVVNSDGTLANNASMIPSVASGAVPMGDMLMSYLSNQNPIYALDAMPFLATSYPQAEKLWQAQKPAVEKLLAQQGLMLLYAVPWPPQGLYTKKPVQSITDLKGQRIRSYNATLAELIKLSGGIPTEISVPQIPQAFSTGMVQAMITSPATGANSQAWDYVSYFYDVKAWIPKDMVIVNKSMFDALPKDQREAVLAAAKAAEKRGWAASHKVYADKMGILKSHGMHIAPPTPQLKSALDGIGKKMLSAWEQKAGSAGKAVIEHYQASLSGN
jgi:TRAP-type transport system periplasmic protein